MALACILIPVMIPDRLSCDYCKAFFLDQTHWTQTMSTGTQCTKNFDQNSSNACIGDHAQWAAAVRHVV